MAELLSTQSTERTVLIVDDEEALAQAIAATLDLEGLRTVVAHTGDEALDKASALQPDLILLDIMMPGKSGIEVCATLKADPRTAPIPVVLVTAKADDVDRAVGFAAGADEYMTKPFSPIELIHLVNHVLKGGPVGVQVRKAQGPASQADQLVVYARELKELMGQERTGRQALEAAYRRLDEVDRLKGDFLGVVTHELMTPFSDIGMGLQVLQRLTADAGGEMQEAVENLATKIGRLQRMIGGLVKFSELSGKRREPQLGYVSLTNVIPWAVQPVAVLARSREIEFRVLVPPDLSKVHADPDLLGEAVFQMAHNAVKFNRPGGKVQVRVYEAEQHAVIEVTDTGVGLSREQIKQLGQPFEQSADALRRGEEGLGIGWAFARYVAEVHGGSAKVESQGPDEGSAFVLSLPTAEVPE